MIKKNKIKEKLENTNCYHDDRCESLIDTSHLCRLLVAKDGCTDNVKNQCNKTCSILNKTCRNLPECKDIRPKEFCEKLKKNGCIFKNDYVSTQLCSKTCQKCFHVDWEQYNKDELMLQEQKEKEAKELEVQKQEAAELRAELERGRQLRIK